MTDLKDLTDEQRAAAEALAAGSTIEDVAAAQRISPEQLRLWLAEHPWFKAAVNRSRAELHRRTTDSLRSLLPRAVDALRGGLEDPEIGPALALKLLKLAGYADFKTTLIGPRSGAAVLDSHAVALSDSPLAAFSGPLPGDRERALREIERKLGRG